MNKAIILILLLAVVSGLFVSQQTKVDPRRLPAIEYTSPIDTISPTSMEISVNPSPNVVSCGGKRGLLCPEGYRCIIPTGGADLMGTCVQ